MTRKHLVIYYDGTQNKAAVLEGSYSDSSVPDMWGLPDNFEIVAVISQETTGQDGMIPIDFRAQAHTVWIDEEMIDLSVAPVFDSPEPASSDFTGEEPIDAGPVSIAQTNEQANDGS